MEDQTIIDNEAENKDLHNASDKKEKEKVDPKKEFCLLYTSPSPRDISGSRMPSSA